MGAVFSKIQTGEMDNEFFAEYVHQRTGFQKSEGNNVPRSFFKRLLGAMKAYKIKGIFIEMYLKCIKYLIPHSLRPMIFIETGIGERHQWMYDRYGLAELMREVGFTDIMAKNFNDSCIPDFNKDCLDCNSDGTQYKYVSLYFEARKPLV